jgi:class 3 adenylate cyclase
LRALLAAQRRLASPASDGATPLRPLALKAGLHHGPCLAINQNDRLDYFGSSVNFAARLCPLATGADLVLSDAVRSDPEAAAIIDENRLRAIPEQAILRGFVDESFTVWRVQG